MSEHGFHQQQAPLRLTEAAVTKVKTLLALEDEAALKLRVYVTGGGCSGFQYGFEFDETVEEDDFAMTQDDLTVLIDAMSFPYLMGAEVDYVEGLTGAQFAVKNPNAKSTCGCGSSFTV